MAHIVSRRTILLSLPALGLARAASAQAARKGIAVYPVATASYQQQFVAAEQGFFKDEGYDFKMLQGGSGVRAREIMAAGEADFALEDILHSLQLNNRGRPARTIVAADTRAASTYFVIRKDLYDAGIDTVEKFAKWKRPDGRKPILGVSSIGGTAHLWAHYFMDAFGYADDVNWVGLGNVDTMLGALRSKQIDLLSATAAMRLDAEKNGWAKLIFLGSDPANWERWVGGSVPVNAHICLLSTIQKEPEKTQAYVNAAYRAGQWIKTHSPEEIFACIEKFVGDTTRDASLAEIEAIKAATDYNGMIDAAAFARGSKAWYRELTGIKPVALEDVFEGKFLRAAQAKHKPA